MINVSKWLRIWASEPLSQSYRSEHSMRAPPWSSGSVLDHRSLPLVFESQRGHISRLFHLWLRFITYEGRSAHLVYHVHKSGCKTPIITEYSMHICQLFLIGYSFRSNMAAEHIVVTYTLMLKVEDALDSFEEVQMKIKEIEDRRTVQLYK